MRVLLIGLLFLSGGLQAGVGEDLINSGEWYHGRRKAPLLIKGKGYLLTRYGRDTTFYEANPSEDSLSFIMGEYKDKNRKVKRVPYSFRKFKGVVYLVFKVTDDKWMMLWSSQSLVGVDIVENGFQVDINGVTVGAVPAGYLKGSPKRNVKGYFIKGHDNMSVQVGDSGDCFWLGLGVSGEEMTKWKKIFEEKTGKAFVTVGEKDIIQMHGKQIWFKRVGNDYYGFFVYDRFFKSALYKPLGHLKPIN